MSDLISRNHFADRLKKAVGMVADECTNEELRAAEQILAMLQTEPGVKLPISEGYVNAVLTWLMTYQIDLSDLKGKYTPYEVCGWIINDFRKEFEDDKK